MNTETISDSLSIRKHNIVFQSLMNFYYHEDAERKYSILLNWTAFLSIIFSSASFAAIGDIVPSFFVMHRDAFIAISAFAITCLNSIVLAFGVLNKMELHRDLKRKWSSLYGSARLTAEVVEQIDSIENLFYELNKEEPPAAKKRLEKAYEHACTSMGLKMPHRDS